MKRNTKRRKNKLEQLVISVIFALLVAIISYVVLPEENKEQKSDKSTNVVTKINSIITISEIPEYSGKIVIDINNNIPYFEEKNITTEDFEDYSKLDELERAGVAFANVCKYTMPPKGVKRGNISYKPTGWNQYLYGENNSKHLYERCHLIAWQLGNENNNKQNLITGTSQMNATMIEYENSVANWIKEKNNQNKDYHVLYRVTPIYNDKNLLATGVEIEAKSVEEEGIAFNKFIYNVQDNFEIDYSTGKAKLIE